MALIRNLRCTVRCNSISSVLCAREFLVPTHNNIRLQSSVSCMEGVANKIAIVTGSARGIGLAIAEGLLSGGAKHVVLSDTLVDECEKSAINLNNKYGEDKAFYQPCDVTKPAEFEKVFKCAVDRFKQIDIVVNNAGILADARWEQCVAINIMGVVRGSLLAFKYMGCHENGQGGVIVNVASILGLDPCPAAPVYTGSKHFVNGFTKSMGSDYFYDLTRVKVMSMGPGVTHTAMIDANPDEAIPGFGDTKKLLENDLGSLPDQPAEACGKCILNMLKADINGSIWIIEGNECYQVCMPDRASMRANCQKEKSSPILCPPKKSKGHSTKKNAFDSSKC